MLQMRVYRQRYSGSTPMPESVSQPPIPQLSKRRNCVASSRHCDAFRRGLPLGEVRRILTSTTSRK